MQQNISLLRWMKVILLILVTSTTGISQMTNSLFFMNGVPQRSQINPAFQPECNFFIGLPLIAPLQADAHNSRLALNDVIYYNEEIDSLITFLHPLGDKDAFLAQLGNGNFTSAETSTSLASMGFRSKKLYLTFDISDRIFTNIFLPDDVADFAIDPDSGKFYDFNRLSVDLTAMTQFSMGVSRNIGDKLTVGIRGNIYLGWANLKTEQFDFSVATNEAQWNVESDIQLNSSWPYYLRDNIEELVTFGTIGTYEEILGDYLDSVQTETDELIDDTQDNPYREFKRIARSLFDPTNFGLGLDIGADYRVNDWLQVSASLLDFGRIMWDKGIINLNHNVDYTFDGIDFSLGGDQDFLEAFKDSLENVNQFIASETGYNSWLPAKLFAGAAIYVHPKISFGALSRTDFYRGNIRQQFTVSANLYPVRMLNATFSYSVMNSYYKNIGVGLALKVFPFNLYIITDTGSSAAMWWDEAKSINMRIGMNLMFGCPKNNGKRIDRPLIN